MFMKSSRDAFQSLLAKLRPESMRSSFSAMSAPAAAEISSAMRHGVGAVLIHDLERIDHVALGLRHLLLVGIAHQAVHVNFAERHLARHLEAEHDHARHPEEQDVEAGDQQRSGIEGLRDPPSPPASRASRTATGRS